MSSEERIEEVSNSAALVFPIYVLAILPLALYVYHDILNARFKRVQNLDAYGLAYTWLFVTSAIAIFGYMVVQFKGKSVPVSPIFLLQSLYRMRSSLLTSYCLTLISPPSDFKEVGASVVALLLGGYGFWKCAYRVYACLVASLSRVGYKR